MYAPARARTSSMQDVYGSPNENDPTAKVERAMNTVDARIKRVWEKVAPMYSRPLGSQAVPAEAEFQEYIATAGTPEERTQHFASLATEWRKQGMTLAEAVDMALSYEKRNEKRLEGYE